MLRELHISNLALITDVRIELHRGLNCFTGATGAGKSLVIGALEVLLGLRSAAELLRAGADEGRVSGLFDLSDAPVLKQIETLTDVPVSADGGELLLTRRLHASGRTSASLNGNPITLGMLKQISEYLVDVHGQHDQQYLLKPANQLEVLDWFGGHLDLCHLYQHKYREVVEAKGRLQELSTSRELRTQQLALYRFQAEEIDAAEPDPGEYQELLARSSLLQNLEKLKKELGATYSALYESDGAVLERLKMMGAVLGELTGIDRHLEPIQQGMRDSTIQLEETAFDLSRYLDRLDLDPAELAEVEERLNVIGRLLGKYGQTVEATLAYRAQIGGKIAELEKATDDLSLLSDALRPMLDELTKLGRDLSCRRKGSAEKLAPLITRELSQLGMERAQFSIALTPAAQSLADEALPASPSGFDQVEFIVQTNPGQAPQPLRKIASGGELSRVMLAVKGIVAAGDRISVLVFDEIDANVGGRLGSIIGDKLRQLAAHHQVLCISHLPQIASYADRHLTVRKDVVGGQTQTTVRVVQGPERLEELAEMIGGRRVTDVTRAQARELLEAAEGNAQPVERATPPESEKQARRARVRG